MSRTGLAHVTDWIFDLDNTLYPHGYSLFAQIDVLITRYVMDVTGLPHDEARLLQKRYYQEQGTTLNGLMTHYGIDPQHYLKAVHAIDYSCVEAHPALVAVIKALPGRKFIFTNANTSHAEEVLTRIGGTHLFDGMFDICAAQFVPKPARGAYERFVAVFGIDPDRAVMFDDLEKNLFVPHEMGMATVHVVPDGNYVPVDRDHWEFSRADVGLHVHHVTDDLVGFLTVA
jgi:putative hydrolase of the HAD superfamily